MWNSTVLTAALNWQGARLNAEMEYVSRGDRQGQFKLAQKSGKSYLDGYLVRMFGITDHEARDVTNAITFQNLKPNLTATVEEFIGEDWADKTILDRQ